MSWQKGLAMWLTLLVATAVFANILGSTSKSPPRSLTTGISTAPDVVVLIGILFLYVCQAIIILSSCWIIKSCITDAKLNSALLAVLLACIGIFVVEISYSLRWSSSTIDDWVLLLIMLFCFCFFLYIAYTEEFCEDTEKTAQEELYTSLIGYKTEAKRDSYTFLIRNETEDHGGSYTCMIYDETEAQGDTYTRLTGDETEAQRDFYTVVIGDEHRAQVKINNVQE